MTVQDPSPPGAHVDVQHIVFAAGGHRILDGIDLVVARGERIGVIGPNGSGKSTLLRCLYGWHRPQDGVVLLDGSDVGICAPDARARTIAVLAQDEHAGLGLTVQEMVALGRLPHRGGGERDAQPVERALAAVGMTGLRDRAFTTLSGGEQQRVRFARALAQEPRLLILDEPTNHLDIRHQLELLAVARGLGISVVASLHDLNLAASWCDRLCLMADGRLQAVGTPWDVLDPDRVGAVYGVRVVRERDAAGAPHLSFTLG